jgi:hypothetical protein
MRRQAEGFENRVIRKIFEHMDIEVTGDCRNVYNEDLHDV